ncbi:surface lipoprotein assembly modifier [Oceaniglobus trochenteri]|uniref:surface lipoprotein assembly modifier n=1 Tax=Oceaniglobus trochenteri TaxID=2763260 RepID=UPI001D000C20
MSLPLRIDRISRLLGATALVLWAGPLAGVAQTGDSIRLSIPESRRVAATLLNDGESAAARDLAQILLQRDPKDFAALVILAQAELRMARLKPAVAAGRRAFSAARTDGEKYLAADVTAGALNQMGARTRAQIWLRRAAQYAPDKATARRVASDYRHVRAANPLSFRFNFGVRPSSNINNGSQHDTERFGSLSRVLEGSEKALSGLEYSLEGALQYRIDEGKRHKSWLSLGADAQIYSLSQSAKEMAPEARASDYNYREVTLGFGHTRAAPDGKALTTFTFDLEHSWTGDTARSRSAQAAVSRRFALNDTTQAQLRGAVEKNWRLDRRIDDSMVYSVSGALSFALRGGNLLSAQVGVARSDSDSYRTAYDSAHVSVSLDMGKPVLGADVSLWASLQQRDYDLPYVIFAPREDTRASLGATLFFRDLDAYGFAPTLDVGFSRNRSNVDAYDGRSLTVGLGLKSTF